MSRLHATRALALSRADPPDLKMRYTSRHEHRPATAMLISVLASAALLGACGGGGDDGEPAGADLAGSFAPVMVATAANSAQSADPATAVALASRPTSPIADGGAVPAAAAPPSADPTPAPAITTASTSPPAATGSDLPLVWRSNLEIGVEGWPGNPVGWGVQNRSYAKDVDIAGNVLRVFIPKGSIDPATMRNRGLPYGGTGFQSLLPAAYEVARLSYKVRFPADFAQARGGKLPGLCGGACNGGGTIPNGVDGFSARYMWVEDFSGSIYAYTPNSVTYGTYIGRKQIPLTRGEWVQLTQEIKLNRVGSSDGHVKVWVNGQLVVYQQDVLFRTTERLKTDRIYFDVFYGGSDDSWAAPKDTTIEFAEFAVYAR